MLFIAALIGDYFFGASKIDHVNCDLAQPRFAPTIEASVIGGYNGELRPQQNITRAETAAIIQRYFQKAEFIS